MKDVRRFGLGVLVAALAGVIWQMPSIAQTSPPDLFKELHWRMIGPFRAGRVKAATGVPQQPNVFYFGAVNGGVWKTTDYGRTWNPIFDDQPTGSIGAIAIAPSNPDIIYVGSGEGLQRPDLSTGDGIYKSTDAGDTWTHLGLRDGQQIPQIVIDPQNPDRLFAAVLGHPYGPNEERGIFRSTDGGRTFQKVLYKDENTGGIDVALDPSNANHVYAVLWEARQGPWENGDFAGPGSGLFESTDGGNTWHPLTNGLPTFEQGLGRIGIAIAPSDPRRMYAAVEAGRNGGLFRSDDAGQTWRKATDNPIVVQRGDDFAEVKVDPKNPDVVYTGSIVAWRSTDGGRTFHSLRGAPGGDDYHRFWINPDNPDIILIGVDQGATISVNGGKTWSSWYNQPTAQFYHVSTDNSFPYRVCGGQQESGSACVQSRGDDGRITFREWHPVGVEEYGYVAPDPLNPDIVYGGKVSRYDRKTGDVQQVGPHPLRGGQSGDYRTIRTQPILFSPVDPHTLYFASNTLWKTTTAGNGWTQISPDLTRKTWEVSPNVGKYIGTPQAEPSQRGVIYTIAPSPLDINRIWVGTDDGLIHVTRDGGKNWTNVTPPELKPWAKVSIMDASHFDVNTAYAAINTIRLDDLRPHIYRTKDGGKTWTHITNGIPDGATINTVKEDPKQRGLLFAGSETQVWVSFDDGDHWSSLRQNMPAISVRDIAVKDDTTCMCADLLAGTHGRGFWILDDVTPLRQVAAARAAKAAYLFEPVTALRVRNATNDPTPWPPEILAGENPPSGGIIDYYLVEDAQGPVKLDIIDAAGDVVRSYSSEDAMMDPHPALDREAYDRICQAQPTTVFCRFPLYWPAPPMVISTKAGMHRVAWDLHYQPVGDDHDEELDATGAVPGRTYPAASAPWAPPGRYRVRLTANGKTYEQPLTLRLDPRVKTPAAGLAKLASLTKEMYRGAVAAHAAYLEARALSEKLEKSGGANAAALRARIDSMAPEPQREARPQFRRGPAGPATTLDAVSDAMLAAAMAMQGADVTPTSMQIAECDAARAQYEKLMKRWEGVKREAGR